MKKKLYFHIWVSPDFERNIAVLVHKICLKHYIDVFDEVNFIAAVDDYPSMRGDLLKAIDFINDVCGDKEYNLIAVKNDPNLGEINTFFGMISPLIIKRENEMVFNGHIKGISDVNIPFRNKYSVLRWIISMYYYSFEHIEDAENKLENGYAAYGPLLTHYPGRGNTHDKIYIGTFYWLNPHSAYDSMLFKNIPSELNDRFLVENFPMLLKEESLASYNMAYTENTIADLYHLKKELWYHYLKNYGDADELFKMQNQIIKEVCGEYGV